MHPTPPRDSTGATPAEHPSALYHPKHRPASHPFCSGRHPACPALEPDCAGEVSHLIPSLPHLLDPMRSWTSMILVGHFHLGIFCNSTHKAQGLVSALEKSSMLLSLPTSFPGINPPPALNSKLHQGEPAQCTSIPDCGGSLPAPGRCHQHPNQDVSSSCLKRTNRPGVGLGGEGLEAGATWQHPQSCRAQGDLGTSNPAPLTGGSGLG